MRLTKGLLFTDIHWGKKQNSDTHNDDCTNFINFVCENVIPNKIDHIIFLGDWFEHRNAINISTLNYAYHGAKKLNDLGIPIYFIIGNHDMYTKVHRNVYATIEYKEFTNFTVIDQPLLEPNIGNGVLLCPFLIHEEYDILNKYDAEHAYGHFEFNGFVLTGATNTFSGGYDHTDFKRYKRIFSGHFHKRQKSGNVIYIGNTFPMDFSDANDFDRGFAIHDHSVDSVTFVNWKECPKYIRTSLSEIVNGTVEIPDNSYISCVADINMEYSKMMEVKSAISSTYNLASITITEPTVQITNDDVEEITDTSNINTHDAIITMLDSISSPSIDNEHLVKIYKKL